MNYSNHSLLMRLSTLLLVLILSGICVVTSAFWPNEAAETMISSAKISSIQDTSPGQEHNLILKECNGKLCVYSGSILLFQTDIPVASLPERDRIALSEGIAVDSEAELHQRLEDFGA